MSMKPPHRRAVTFVPGSNAREKVADEGSSCRIQWRSGSSEKMGNERMEF
jgi:hypothetical protein